MSEYLAEVQDLVEDYWESRGEAVQVINLSPLGPPGRHGAIKSLIQYYHATHGTKYFHIVADAGVDEFASSLWESSPYWRSRRAAYRARGLDRAGSNTASAIPSFVTPDVETLGLTPYSLSDQEYGDIDDDGVPDVVVTRWPVTNASELEAIATKMQAHNDRGVHQPFTTAFFVGNQDYNGIGSGDFAKEAADTVEARLVQVAPEEDLAHLYQTDVPDYPVRNDSTAAVINSRQPELIVLLASASNLATPGRFFWAANDPPGWDTEEMLQPGTVVPLIMAASCNAATTAHTDDWEEMCFDLLFCPDKGAAEWIGATGASNQTPNRVLSGFLVEELFQNPQRPMAESWLIAVQRALAYFEDDPYRANTIKSYVFLGDPLSPFRPSVNAQVSSFVRKSGDPVLYPWSEKIAVGCPQGDRDHIVVSVAIDEQDVANPIPAEAITFDQPAGSDNVFYGSLVADSSVTLSNGYYRTTITVDAFGVHTCGVDSATVRLYNMDLGYAHFQLKSFDLETSGTTRGKVDMSDLANFATHFPSSVCNCLPNYAQYWSCVDYVPLDTIVNVGDLSVFGPHYQHSVPGAGLSPARAVEAASGTISLVFDEDNPLMGPRTLRASVQLRDVGPFQVMFLSFKNENSIFRFNGWQQDSGFKGRTGCVDVVRNGQKEIVVVAVGPKAQDSRTVDLGSFELEVLSEEPLQLTGDDFSLQTADVLSLGGRALAFGGSQVQRSTEPEVFRNELAQNYPNPFNPTTTIAFSIATDSDVELVIYDVAGARVRTLVREHRQPNNYRELWDGKSDLRGPVASGVYFYRLTAGAFTATKKMVLIR